MATRVGPVDGVIGSVGISVLPGWFRCDAGPRVTSEESPSARIVVPTAEVDESSLSVNLFAGKLEGLIVGAPDGCAIAVLVRQVGGPYRSVSVGDLADRADLIGVVGLDRG